MTHQNKNPHIVGAIEGGRKLNYRNYTPTGKKRKFNRSLLPKPSIYYAGQFPQVPLKYKSGWTTVLCCFHNDQNPSLRINQQEGHFRCFSCGAKGHDILAFHQLRYELDFIDAVTELGAWSHE